MTTATQSVQIKRRARRKNGFAVRAEAEARRWAIEHQQLPSTAKLRELVGGGSQRDLTRARAAAATLIASETREIDVHEIERLRGEVTRLMVVASNAERVADERVRGLERHLLLETARIRDELEQRAKLKSPFGTVVQTIQREVDPREEKIFE